jgi:hypothetical protein
MAVFQTLEVKSKAQILYEKHAVEAGLKSPWKSLSGVVKAPWEKRADPNYVEPVKSKAKPTDERKAVKPETKAPKSETIAAKNETAVAQILNVMYNHLAAMDLILTQILENSSVLPPWSEMKAESDTIKIKWLELVCK